MTEIIKNWNDTCNRFVAYLDIMGFKERVYRESHEDIKKMFESLHPTIEDMRNYAIAHMISKSDIPKYKTSFIFPVSFSDSIILISGDNSDLSALLIITTAGSIIHQSVKKGIPMKGAIAYGEMTADINKSLYFGKPLIDAYELQKELKLYGVVLHYTFEKYLLDTKSKKNIFDVKKLIMTNGTVLQYTVPTKSGKINYHLCDWTFWHSRGKKPIDLVRNLYKSVSGAPRIYVDNTLEFVNEIQKRKAEFKRGKKS